MSRKDTITLAVASTITTLAEFPDRPSPEGPIYMALMHIPGFGLDDWMQVRTILLQMKTIKLEPGPCLRITDTGMKLAADLEAARNGGSS